jgi:hypothetical protein
LICRDKTKKQHALIRGQDALSVGFSDLHEKAPAIRRRFFFIHFTEHLTCRSQAGFPQFFKKNSRA